MRLWSNGEGRRKRNLKNKNEIPVIRMHIWREEFIIKKWGNGIEIFIFECEKRNVFQLLKCDLNVQKEIWSRRSMLRNEVNMEILKWIKIIRILRKMEGVIWTSNESHKDETLNRKFYKIEIKIKISD